MLSNEVQISAARSVLCWLATVNEKGQPNVSPKEIFAAFDTQHLVIANIASPTSVRNIGVNPLVSVSFIDVFVQKGFKVSGAARNVRRQDVDFSRWAAPLEAKAGSRFPIHSVLVVRATAIEPILAPSYRLYPTETTEQSQVAAAMRAYGVEKSPLKYLNKRPQLDLAATAVRAFMLYSLTEFQSGNATTIRVTAEGSAFSISDDGRGHPIDKSVDGTSYLRFIYSHFDYPFEASRSVPIQLQGIGMSLVNALCSELTLMVRKRDESLTMSFKDGQLQGTSRSSALNDETGITVSAQLRLELPEGGTQKQELEEWLQGIVQVHPTLKLYFNGRELKAPPQSDTEPPVRIDI